MQDNSQMTYTRTSGLTTNMSNAVAWALTNRIAPTDVALQAEQGTPDSNTDVLYYENLYTGTYCGNTWWGSGGLMVGYTSCQSLSSLRCQQAIVYFSKHWDTSTSATQSKRQNLATHETGHSLGLTHPVDGVPASSVMGNWTTVSAFDSQHEVVGHINLYY
jgi:hypothetical protein